MSVLANKFYVLSAVVVPENYALDNRYHVLSDDLCLEFTRRELEEMDLRNLSVKFNHESHFAIGRVVRSYWLDKVGLAVTIEIPMVDNPDTPEGAQLLEVKRRIIDALSEGMLKDVSISHRAPVFEEGSGKFVVYKLIGEISVVVKGGKIGSNIFNQYWSDHSLFINSVYKEYTGHLSDVVPVIRTNLPGRPSKFPVLPPLTGRNTTIKVDNRFQDPTICISCTKTIDLMTTQQQQMQAPLSSGVTSQGHLSAADELAILRKKLEDAETQNRQLQEVSKEHDRMVYENEKAAMEEIRSTFVNAAKNLEEAAKSLGLSPEDEIYKVITVSNKNNAEFMDDFSKTIEPNAKTTYDIKYLQNMVQKVVVPMAVATQTMSDRAKIRRTNEQTNASVSAGVVTATAQIPNQVTPTPNTPFQQQQQPPPIQTGTPVIIVSNAAAPTPVAPQEKQVRGMFEFKKQNFEKASMSATMQQLLQQEQQKS